MTIGSLLTLLCACAPLISSSCLPRFLRDEASSNHGESAVLSPVPRDAPGQLHLPAGPAPTGLVPRRLPPRHRPLPRPRRGPPCRPRRRQGARLLPGGQPRRPSGGDAGHGGGERGVLPAAGGGQGGLLLRGHRQAQPPLLQHHLRDRRREVLAGLPPPRLRLPRRRHQERLARQAPQTPGDRGEVRGADEGRGDGATAAVVRGHGDPAGLLRGGSHRRRRDHQRQPLPTVPGPGPDAWPAAALRPEPHHPAPPGRRPGPPGLLQGRLDRRRARARRLRRQLRPPARDRDQRSAEEHRAPGDDELGAGADVRGDVPHAGGGQRRWPRGGARRRRLPGALPHRDVCRVHARVQDRRRAEGERGEGLQALI